jgi:hypothetical protein
MAKRKLSNAKMRFQAFEDDRPLLRSAGFQTCCAADFQIGPAALRMAGLETCDTADLEVCATNDPGRSNARKPEAVGIAGRNGRSHVAAPEDGRAPEQEKMSKLQRTPRRGVPTSRHWPITRILKFFSTKEKGTLN